MNKRLATAMGAYAGLLALAFLLLQDRRVLYAALIAIGGLALKTLIAVKRGS